MSRQRNNLKYAVVGHISRESESPSVRAMCRTVTTTFSDGAAVPAAHSKGGGRARVWRAGQDG